MSAVRSMLSFFGAAGLLFGASGAQPVAADSVADFYKGKTVNLFVGQSAGGGYDTYARTVARHLGKHIPGNPTVVVRNRPGAGSLVLTNELYNILPKDGTVLALIARGMPMEPLLGNEKAKYDARKFNWIGSANNEVSICVAWHTTPIQRFEDLYTQEMVVGGTGSGADTALFPKILNNVLGTKMKLIVGYPGGNDINLAMERGEVQGRCGYSWSSAKSRNAEWLEQKKIRILAQISTEKHEELPDVPLIMDFVKDPDDRRAMELIFARQVMGRPFVAPPGVPAARVRALRAAFNATVKDPEFLAETGKQDLEVNPVTGERIAKLLDEIYASSPRAIALAKEAVTSEAKTQITKKKQDLVETVSTTIAKIENGGRELQFKNKDKVHKVRISGSRTKLTVGGKNASRKDIKVGMACDISYQGDGSEAKNIACQ